MSATTFTRTFADDKDCKKNDDNNCNENKKIQKSNAKAECEVDTEIKDHNKNSIVGPVDLQCNRNSQSLIDSNIQSSPPDDGNIGDDMPQITLEPNNGSSFSSVNVFGSGFGTGGLAITVTFDGLVLWQGLQLTLMATSEHSSTYQMMQIWAHIKLGYRRDRIRLRLLLQ